MYFLRGYCSDLIWIHFGWIYLDRFFANASKLLVAKANNTEDYVHRIGRTGRAGAKGYAVTFICPSEDGGKVSGIIQVGCYC